LFIDGHFLNVAGALKSIWVSGTVIAAFLVVDKVFKEKVAVRRLRDS
jgi:hypothetical protein